MAKIKEELIVIKVSKLLKKNDDASTPILDADTLAGLEAVAVELVEAIDPSAVVELIIDDSHSDAE